MKPQRWLDRCHTSSALFRVACSTVGLFGFIMFRPRLVTLQHIRTEPTHKQITRIWSPDVFHGYFDSFGCSKSSVSACNSRNTPVRTP